MKANKKGTHDFSKGKRGPIAKPAPEPAGKVKITIRLDADIVDHFMAKADESGGAVGYQTLLNEALRRSLEAPKLEAMMRRVIREELHGQPGSVSRVLKGAKRPEWTSPD